MARVTKRTCGQKKRKRIIDNSKKKKRLSKPQIIFKKRLFRFTKFIKCCFCRKSLSYGEATVEHIIPKSKGGPDHWTNFGISCEPCNNERGTMNYDLFKSIKENKK